MSIILYPTDTLYALGVDATDLQAVRQLFVLKGRPETKPVSIMVESLEAAEPYVVITPLAKKLATVFLPGKITLVLTAKETLPPLLTARTGTVGIRIPDNPMCRELMKRFTYPLTCTSANVSGEKTGTNPKEILNQFGDQSHMITEVIDGGTLKESPPSTIVDVRGNVPIILREGAIAANEIRRSY